MVSRGAIVVKSGVRWFFYPARRSFPYRGIPDACHTAGPGRTRRRGNHDDTEGFRHGFTRIDTDSTLSFLPDLPST